MTTATHFTTRHRPLPFCVQHVDASAFDYTSNLPPMITGLSFNDAVYLFWNLEDIAFAYDLSGIVLTSTATVASKFASTMSGVHTKPNGRICTRDGLDGYIDESGTEINGGTVVLLGVTTHYDVVASFQFTTPIVSIPGVTDCLFFDTSSSSYFLVLGLSAGGGTSPYVSGITGLGLVGNGQLSTFIDKTILSGTVRIHGYADPTLYASGGTLNSLTLTPSYYSY